MSAFYNTINRREDGNASLQEAEVVPQHNIYKSRNIQKKRWI